MPVVVRSLVSLISLGTELESFSFVSLCLCLNLHEVPHVLDSIQVGATARPIRLVTMEWLLGKEIVHPLGKEVESGLQVVL
jgi:hypothetical protein